MTKIFLGGTCEGFNWRKVLINKLSHLKNAELFNPIVDKWDDEARKIENEYKENCDICLYVITPFMSGCYSIAEAVDDSNKRPNNTIFVHINKVVDENSIYEFTEKMEKSIKAVCEIITKNGGLVFDSFNDLIDYLENTIK